jgi:hypothetical protein
MSNGSGFVRKKFTGTRIFQLLVMYIGLAAALDTLCREYIENDGIPPLLWALSVSFGMFLLFGILNYCAYAQSTLQDEIDRMAKAKERLESKVIPDRKSSKKRRG